MYYAEMDNGTSSICSTVTEARTWAEKSGKTARLCKIYKIYKKPKEIVLIARHSRKDYSWYPSVDLVSTRWSWTAALHNYFSEPRERKTCRV